jgi:GT2 family glycosyltransferase
MKHFPSIIWYAGAKVMMWCDNAIHVVLGQKDGEEWSGFHVTEHVSGACLLAKRELFENASLLDEDYFFGYKDWDFSFNAAKKGFQFGVNLDSIIYHKSSGGFW